MAEVQELNLIEQTVEYVKQTLCGDSSGHDWWHIYRVWKTAKKIQTKYHIADSLVVELTALLHDIADWKSNGGDFSKGSVIAREWLNTLDDITINQIDHICHNIENISFRGKNVTRPKLSIEGQIVQDADRLDAMGAIGIARTFAFGGNRGRLIYDPKSSNYEADNMTDEQHKSCSISHFYEKLLLIKDLMNTKYGKDLAQRRHKFMTDYLTQFYLEWDGKG